MICKPFEVFLRDRHGDAVWERVCAAAGHPRLRFEAMRRYPDTILTLLVAAASRDLSQPPSSLLEDVGTWLCTNPAFGPLRRLIRFSGPDFETLVRSLEDLHARAQLAIRDLDMPNCRVFALGPGRYDLRLTWARPGGAAVMAGMLRGMADEYGALAIIERGESREGSSGWTETISVSVIDLNFAAPRAFSLAGLPS
jgi:hypothetical protein